MKKQTIGHQRLAKLATFLYSVPREHFDIRRWASDGFDASAPACGTTACAIGWATGIFKTEGFILAQNLNDFSRCRMLLPYYNGSYNWDAITRFFGISYNHALRLFTTKRLEDNRGPRQVAKDIKRFLKL